MSVSFIALGGALDRADEKPPIGGSMYLLKEPKTNHGLVIDCGAYPLPQEERVKQTELALQIKEKEKKKSVIGGVSVASLPKLRFDAFSADLDFDLTEITGKCFPDFDELESLDDISVIITHAHVDHIGALVFLKKRFPRAKVYMTKATKEISAWSWYDSLKIARDEKRVLLFSEWDIEDLRKEILLVSHGSSFTRGPYKISISHAGHILGAIGVHVSLDTPGAPSLFFTGDTSMSHQHSIEGAEFPESSVDILVTESTYAGQMQEDRGFVERSLAHGVEETISRGGKVLFPALSIGRPLEIFSILKQHGITDICDVYIDGSARKIAGIYASHDHAPLGIEKHFIGSQEERERLFNTSRPLVVIASGGMLYRGSVAVQYTGRWAGDEKNLISFSSYIDPCSPGYRILNMRPGKRLRLGNTQVQLNAKVVQYGLSAHIGHDEILETVDRLSPSHTFLVHGNEAGMDQLIAESGANLHKTFLDIEYSLV